MPDLTHATASPTPGSFWHPRAKLRNIAAFGTRWTADRYAAVDTGKPAPDERDETAVALRRIILMVLREPAEPRIIGDRVLLGPAVIDAAYYRLVQDRYPAAEWEADGELEPVVAVVGERAVAVVMPLRGVER